MSLLKISKINEISHTNETFKALIEALAPESQNLIVKYENRILHEVSYQSVYEYEIWTLNHSLSQTILKIKFNINLANPTAKMLDKAAKQLIESKNNKEPVNSDILRKIGDFAALAPSDRLLAIDLLEKLRVNLSSLPIPFWNNAGFVLLIVGELMMLNTIGYYSGGHGYDFSNLKIGARDKSENYYSSWKEVGYPGPSKGYKCLKGYLIDKFTE